MRIQVLSDLHLESEECSLSPTPGAALPAHRSAAHSGASNCGF